MYCRPITITNNTDKELRDYAVLIELIEDNFEFPTPDGSDIYFLDDEGYPAYYWIEYYNQAEKYAKIWLKVKYIPPNSSVTYQMYYGGTNPYPDYNDRDQVFILYEDFENNQYNSDKLTIDADDKGTWEISDEIFYSHTYSDGSSGRVEIISNFSTPGDILIRMRYKWKYYMASDTSTHFMLQLFVTAKDGNDYEYQYQFEAKSTGDGMSYGDYGIPGCSCPNDSSCECYYNNNSSPDTWYDVELKPNIEFPSNAEPSPAPEIDTINQLKWHNGSWWAETCWLDVWIDYIIIRPYVDPEPSVSVGEAVAIIEVSESLSLTCDYSATPKQTLQYSTSFSVSEVVTLKPKRAYSTSFSISESVSLTTYKASKAYSTSFNIIEDVIPIPLKAKAEDYVELVCTYTVTKRVTKSYSTTLVVSETIKFGLFVEYSTKLSISETISLQPFRETKPYSTAFTISEAISLTPFKATKSYSTVFEIAESISISPYRATRTYSTTLSISETISLTPFRASRSYSTAFSVAESASAEALVGKLIYSARLVVSEAITLQPYRATKTYEMSLSIAEATSLTPFRASKSYSTVFEISETASIQAARYTLTYSVAFEVAEVVTLETLEKVYWTTFEITERVLTLPPKGYYTEFVIEEVVTLKVIARYDAKFEISEYAFLAFKPYKVTFKITEYTEVWPPGTPVVNAYVEFINPDSGRVIASAYTNELGVVHVYIFPGTYKIRVSKPGYRTHEQTEVIQSPMFKQIELEKVS